MPSYPLKLIFYFGGNFVENILGDKLKTNKTIIASLGYLPLTNKIVIYTSSSPPFTLKNQFMGKVSLDRMGKELQSSKYWIFILRKRIIVKLEQILLGQLDNIHEVTNKHIIALCKFHQHMHIFKQKKNTHIFAFDQKGYIQSRIGPG